MTFGEDIKEGFRVINRNLPLIIIQIGVMIISFLVFIIIVGIPVAYTILYIGIDPVRLKEILSNLVDPLGFFQKYTGPVIFIGTAFMLYITVVTCLAIFVFGGNLAIIKNSIRDQSERFSFKKFLKEGKRYFLPLCWLTLILGLLFLLFIFIIGALVGIVIAFMAPYKDEIGKFLIALAAISGIIILFLAFVGFLLLTLSIYAVIGLIVEELRAWRALKRALTFLRNNFLEATGFYFILIVGYIAAVFLMMLASFPFSMIPVIGPIISLPFQFVTSIIQVYLGLVMMASLMVFYTRRSVKT